MGVAATHTHKQTHVNNAANSQTIRQFQLSSTSAKASAFFQPKLNKSENNVVYIKVEMNSK